MPTHKPHVTLVYRLDCNRFIGDRRRQRLSAPPPAEIHMGVMRPYPSAAHRRKTGARAVPATRNGRISPFAGSTLFKQRRLHRLKRPAIASSKMFRRPSPVRRNIAAFFEEKAPFQKLALLWTHRGA